MWFDYLLFGNPYKSQKCMFHENTISNVSISTVTTEAAT